MSAAMDILFVDTVINCSSQLIGLGERLTRIKHVIRSVVTTLYM